MSAAEQPVSVCGEAVSAKMLALILQTGSRRTGRHGADLKTALVYALIAGARKRLRAER
jgi:hypothetical protein